jgi:hypothetical protein
VASSHVNLSRKCPNVVLTVEGGARDACRPQCAIYGNRLLHVKSLRDESASGFNMLTLSDGLKAGKIKEFVSQEEARGIGPADRKKLERR